MSGLYWLHGGQGGHGCVPWDTGGLTRACPWHGLARLGSAWLGLAQLSLAWPRWWILANADSSQPTLARIGSSRLTSAPLGQLGHGLAHTGSG